MRDAPLAGLYVLFYEQSKTKLGGMHFLGQLCDMGLSQRLTMCFMDNSFEGLLPLF